MEVNTYSFDLVDSKAYVLSENDSILIVDPCISLKDAEELRNNGYESAVVLLTHEHYDHILGIDSIRQCWDNCTVICSDACGENIQSPLRNGSKYFAALLIDKSEDLLRRAQLIEPVAYKADRTFQEKLEFIWKGHHISITSTPGHSEGSCCITVDQKLLFTGDSLLRDHDVITRLPGGSRKKYREITIPYLLSLPKEINVFPGHGESGTLEELLRKRNIKR